MSAATPHNSEGRLLSSDLHVIIRTRAIGLATFDAHRGGSTQRPFNVDSSKITKMLGVTATPLDQALNETLLSYSNAESPSAR